MRRRILGLIAAFLFLLPLAYAVSELPDPARVSKLNVRIVQSGEIAAQADRVEWIRVNVTAPQQTEFQTAATQQSTITSPYGDRIFQFYQENPSLPFTYNAMTLATIQATHTLSLPDSYSLPANVVQFLEPTKGIQSNDPRIQQLAKEITKDAVTNFEKVALLAIWVNDYMTYDTTFADRNYDALWALERKIGVCSEYTSLFMALARAINIPARYVSSYAYGNNGWEAHAYAEVYIGQWVPVDALWLEAGNLDATHIKFSVNKDNQAANDVTMFGKDINNLQWSKDTTDIKIVTYDEATTDDNYELLKSSEELGPGEQGVVILKFKGTEYQLMELNLVSCRDPENNAVIVDVQNQKRTLIVEPGKDVLAYWKFTTSGTLQPGARYTCPLTLNSRLLKPRVIDVSINTDNIQQDQVAIDASVSSSRINVGSQQTVTVKATRLGKARQAVTLGILGGGKTDSITIQPFEKERTETFSFPVTHPGKADVVVYTSTGELKVVPYDVTNDGDVVIESMDVPTYAEVGKSYQGTIKLKNRAAGTQLLTAEIAVDGKKGVQQFPLETTKFLTIPFSFSTDGKHEISVKVTGENVNLEQTYAVEAFVAPQLELRSATYEGRTGTTSVVFSSSTSQARNVRLKIGAKEYRVESVWGATTMRTDLLPGSYIGQLSYEDLAGKQYISELDFLVKKKSVIDIFLEWLSGLFR